MWILSKLKKEAGLQKALIRQVFIIFSVILLKKQKKIILPLSTYRGVKKSKLYTFFVFKMIHSDKIFT